VVVDPWGEVLAVREQEGAGVVLAELDADRLVQLRRQLPALDHRVL
jgi:nitrilase